MVMKMVCAAHIPTLIHIQIIEVQEEHQVIPTAILGGSQVIAKEISVAGTAIHDRSRAILL